VHLDFLCESNETIAPWQEWVLEDRPPTIQAVLKYANVAPLFEQFGLKHARPALIKPQALTRRRNNSP
jgi:hypothetical protein